MFSYSIYFITQNATIMIMPAEIRTYEPGTKKLGTLDYLYPGLRTDLTFEDPSLHNKLRTLSVICFWDDTETQIYENDAPIRVDVIPGNVPCCYQDGDGVFEKPIHVPGESSNRVLLIAHLAIASPNESRLTKSGDGVIYQEFCQSVMNTEYRLQ